MANNLVTANWIAPVRPARDASFLPPFEASFEAYQQIDGPRTYTVHGPICTKKKRKECTVKEKLGHQPFLPKCLFDLSPSYSLRVTSLHLKIPSSTTFTSQQEACPGTTSLHFLSLERSRLRCRFIDFFRYGLPIPRFNLRTSSSACCCWSSMGICPLRIQIATNLLSSGESSELPQQYVGQNQNYPFPICIVTYV
jgi:hypothetical protein